MARNAFGIDEDVELEARAAGRLVGVDHQLAGLVSAGWWWPVVADRCMARMVRWNLAHHARRARPGIEAALGRTVRPVERFAGRREDLVGRAEVQRPVVAQVGQHGGEPVDAERAAA